MRSLVLSVLLSGSLFWAGCGRVGSSTAPEGAGTQSAADASAMADDSMKGTMAVPADAGAGAAAPAAANP